MKNKKIIALTLIALTFVGMFSYKKINLTNRNNNVDIILDPSKEFSREELNNAAEKVLSSFNSTWRDSKLHEIRFSNNVYQREMKNREPGTSLFSDIDKENVIILTISFTTGKRVTGSIGPNTYISGWHFILSRENKKSNWKFLDQGV